MPELGLAKCLCTRVFQHELKKKKRFCQTLAGCLKKKKISDFFSKSENNYRGVGWKTVPGRVGDGRNRFTRSVRA